MGNEGIIHKLIEGSVEIDPTTGEAVDYGDIVAYASGQADVVIKGLATNKSAVVPAAGISNQSANSGASIKLGVFGKSQGASGKYNFSGYVGQEVYVSPATPGAATITKPSASGDIIQVVGIAINASTLFVNPQLVIGYTLSGYGA